MQKYYPVNLQTKIDPRLLSSGRLASDAPLLTNLHLIRVTYNMTTMTLPTTYAVPILVLLTMIGVMSLADDF